jgi:dephospho-CoA kinase
VRAIMASQASRAARLAAADDVIDNSRDHAHLRREVEALHRRYLQLAAAGE